MEIITKKVEELIPYKNNPRINDKAIESVANSIREFGFKVPIVIDKNNIIVAGHTRLLASKLLGLKEVPCIIADDLTEDKIKAFRLADNKVAEIAEWDLERLNEELKELANFEIDMSQFGFLEDSIQEIDIIEDEVPIIDENKQPKAKIGQVYKLGNHRLMCGDSTSKEDVNKLLNGAIIDMVFTDPPYNLETKGGCKGEIGKALKKQGNNIEFIANFNPTEFLNILPIVFDKNKINSYIFCNKELLPTYLNWAVENKYSFNVLVWKKPNGIPIGDSHRPDIEYLLFFRKNAIWNNGLKDINYSRCLEFSRETGLHPTMKPIKLITNELEISSNKNSNILDLFGGSGSTLIACEQLNRVCYMMELDPKYVDVIIERWEKFTGKKAELIDG